ncbi:glycosyltransferase family 1 protein [bacterium]|nr:glycosyltransferase family 1 protein [bacterium]
MKVLFVPPQQCYTLELLFDGLVDVLGPENVVDFPRYEIARNAGRAVPYYGGTFAGFMSHLPEPDRSDICSRVLGGEFDLLIINNRNWKAVPRRFFTAVPTVFIDGEDRAGQFFRTEVERLPLLLYFKRGAFLSTPFLRPLTHSYPFRLSHAPSHGRTHRVSGLFSSDWFPRPLLAAAFASYAPDVAVFPPKLALGRDAYRARLADSQVGLDCRDVGCGSVRRAEVMASGCVLVGQPQRVVERHPLEHGTECFYFEEVGDAVQFVDELTEDRYMEMASRSYDKYLTYHTTRARAEQVLNEVEDAIDRRSAS